MTEQTKSSHKLTGVIMLTTCALIWGTAFIAQSIGGQYAEPLTINWARSLLATIFLSLWVLGYDKYKGIKSPSLWGSEDPAYRSKLLKAGFGCGLALSAATYMQQLGIMYTTVGKSGFITALYIVLVPILGYVLLKQQVGLLQGLSVLVAAVGMYFICINESFTINKGDFYTLICALCFALQIIMVEKVIGGLDGVRLSLVQFATCTLVNGLLMFIFESPTLEQLTMSALPLLYLGIMSSGIAYTLQITGQKYVTPVLACMLMSLESAFALLSGWLLLGQTMSIREIGGCGLVFVAIMLAQMPVGQEAK